MLTFYNSKEVPRFKGMYKHGKLNGLAINWDSVGNLVDSAYYKNNKLYGVYKSFYPNQSLHEKIEYSGDLIHHNLLVYFPNGRLKRQDNYDYGEFVNGKCYDSTGIEIKHYDYFLKAEYPGGESALYNYLEYAMKYPEYDKKKLHDGNVAVRFMIDKEGRLKSFTILAYSKYQGFNDEAMRVAKSLPVFKPAFKDGKAVSSSYFITFIFHYPYGVRQDVFISQKAVSSSYNVIFLNLYPYGVKQEMNIRNFN